MNVACPYCRNTIDLDIEASAERTLCGCTSCLSAFYAFSDGRGSEKAAESVDVRFVAPADSLVGMLLSELVGAIEKMPVVPDISRRVMELSADSNASMSALAAIIREDATIAASVLRASNSAIFQGVSEFTTLEAACSRLGVRTLCNIVQTVANEGTFDSSFPETREAMDALRKHSLVVAHTAGALAEVVSEPATDRVYLAGLFHDLGKVALLTALGRADSEVQETIEDDPEMLEEIVSSFSGVAGLQVVQHWKLANEYAVTAFLHGNPSRVWREDWHRITHLVALADALACDMGYSGGLGATAVEVENHPSAIELQLATGQLANVRAELETTFEGLFEAFDIA